VADDINHPSYEPAGAWAKRYFLAVRGVMESVLRPYDLGITQWHILYQLSQAGPTNQRELMHMLKIERQTVSGVIAALVRKGLIEQIPDSLDQRQKILRMTAAGEKLWESLPDPLDTVKKVAFNGVDKKDLALASKVLTEATQRLINYKNGGGK
jgi:MarR family transcriptional regulator, lower aerobic nicotinate degradation pathway regulator